MKTWMGALATALVMVSVWLPTKSLNAQDALRETVNQGTVSIISGGVNGTYIRIAADLASVLDRGNELRILPIIGKGSVQNITDILYLRGIDIGIVQSDVLAYVRKERIHPTIEHRIRYITKLYNEEFHLLAHKNIETIEDLEGQPVNFGNEGGGTFMTASTVFDILGIEVIPTTFDESLALEKLKSGDIAAMVYVAGKPTQLFEALRAEDDIRLISVLPTEALLETYLPSTFSHEDYPGLVAEGEDVPTIAVGAVMAVYNWAPDGDRYDKVARFVEAFFGNFDAFLEPPRHPKWQEVNLAAVVPGWERFAPAEQWLAENAVRAETGGDSELRASFEAFLAFLEEQRESGAIGSLNEAERETLFRQFMRFRNNREQ